MFTSLPWTSSRPDRFMPSATNARPSGPTGALLQLPAERGRTNRGSIRHHLCLRWPNHDFEVSEVIMDTVQRSHIEYRISCLDAAEDDAKHGHLRKSEENRRPAIAT